MRSHEISCNFVAPLDSLLDFKQNEKRNESEREILRKVMSIFVFLGEQQICDLARSRKFSEIL